MAPRMILGLDARRGILPLALLGALACATPTPPAAPSPPDVASDAPATDIQRKATTSIKTRAKGAVQGMIIGSVVGGQIGGLYGAAAGSLLFGMYGFVSGKAFEDDGDTLSDAEIDSEVEEELDRQEALRRQEEELVAIDEQEADPPSADASDAGKLASPPHP